MKINYRSLVLWLMPVVLSFLFELFFADFRGYNIKNLIENVFSLYILLIILSFFKYGFYKKTLSRVIFVIFTLSLSLESLYFFLFNTYFSSSAIFIFLETNPNEAEEFLYNYLTSEAVIFISLNLVLIVLFWFGRHSSILEPNGQIKKVHKFLSLLFITACLYFTGYFFTNLQYQIVKGTKEYISEIEKYKNFNVSNPIGNLENVKFEGTTDPHVFVLIIGESTTRHHLGLYNFYRPTTPNLTNIKDELLIYQDVISSESHTIESLQAALSLNNFKAESESTLIQLFNQAGFKTFWLSNQNPIGFYDTLLTEIALASDEFVFTNPTHYGSKTPYDEVLLPHLDKALNNKSENIFIVLHLLATHGRYELRYPEEFDNFNDIPDTNFKDESNYKHINTYHNSITYIDYFVNQVIERVKSQNKKSYVFYFSDHGEEVFEDRNFFGHNDLEDPTKSMFDIPFFVWLSPQYKSAYTYTFEPERPYSIEYLLHSVSDLSQIDFKEKQSENSIFSKNFEKSKRIISKKLDYDEYFELKKNNSNSD